MTNNILPSYFIPHGGGPWNLMGEQHMKNTGEIAIKKYLSDLGKALKDIDGVIIVTSHWEGSDIGISFVENYNLLYDYYGFPPNTYNVNYKVKGDLELSKKVETLLNDKGIKTFRDSKRGLDHGSFVPLMELFPNIKVPVVQVSISSNLDAKFHYDLGVALSSLKKENILIIGSGMSYHNMRGFFSNDKKYTNDSIKFNEYLEANILNIDELFNWDKHILSKEVHPRSEHFMPFFTILGTILNGEFSRDFKSFTYDVEIVGYRAE